MDKENPRTIPAARLRRLKRLPPRLTVAQVSRRLAISYQVARDLCADGGYQAWTMRQFRLAQIHALPPNLTISEAARRMKASLQVAGAWLRLSGYRSRRSEGSGIRNRKVHPKTWLKVDWSLRDYVIAKLLDVSRERVRQVRKELGTAKRPWDGGKRPRAPRGGRARRG